VLLDVKEASLKLLISLLGLLNEVTDLDEFSFILGLGTDTVLHVSISGINLFNSGTAPGVDLSQDTLFGLECLTAKLLFDFTNFNTEQGGINGVIGQVINLLFSNIVKLDQLPDLFKRLLLFTLEKLLNQLLSVNIEEVLVLLVGVEKLGRVDDVFFTHLSDFLVSLYDPRALHGDFEVRMVVKFHERHEVGLQVVNLIGRVNNHL